MEIKKILICGDSFASTALSQGKGWPDQLKNHYQVTNLAQPGVGEYKILQQIISANLSEFDHIIISHTSPNRVHTIFNPLYPEANHVHHKSDILFADVESKSKLDDTAKFWYNYFVDNFDANYYEYVHNCCCQNIDLLTKDHKTLHITHFDWNNLYQFRYNEFVNFFSVWKKNRGGVNHYNTTGNQLVYQTVTQKIL